MGRPLREEYQGGIYHVIARGNNKEYIFKESIDKGYFIKQLKQTIEGMNCRIFGYVLMDNHYYILIQTLDKKLQEIMHQINNKYSKYFNAKYKRAGHVFQGRYKAILVQDERYLAEVLRYIHQNPVQANICETASGYKLEYAKAALAMKYTYKEIACNISITESSVRDMIYKNESVSK